MAIQNRRGAYVDFDPTKMVAGEFAVVQSGDENTDDGKALYVAPTTGSVKRIPFAEELDGLVEVDDTLTEAGAAADAKKTGDEITALRDDLEQKGLSEDAKVALLNCFSHVVWIDEHGQDYYDALEDALYPEIGLVSISAVFTQGSTVIYPSTPLNDLKAYLVVTGYYNNGTSETITDYALAGTLEVGTSTITVTKEGKTTTFTVNVSPIIINIDNFAVGVPHWNIDVTPPQFEYTDDSSGVFMGANISSLDIEAGDVVGIDDYVTYQFQIGTNEVRFSPYSTGWIQNNEGGNAQTADYTIKAKDVGYTKVMMVRRKDRAVLTQNDLDYINSHAHVTKGV